jgi:hypothetical protein
VVQGESNDKEGKQSFTGLGIAEPKPTLCKGGANEWKENLFSIFRVQPTLCKGGARRVQRQGGKTEFYRTWHCRAEAHLMQRYKIKISAQIKYVKKNNATPNKHNRATDVTTHLLRIIRLQAA